MLQTRRSVLMMLRITKTERRNLSIETGLWTQPAFLAFPNTPHHCIIPNSPTDVNYSFEPWSPGSVTKRSYLPVSPIASPSSAQLCLSMLAIGTSHVWPRLTRQILPFAIYFLYDWTC